MHLFSYVNIYNIYIITTYMNLDIYVFNRKLDSTSYSL